MRLDSPISNVPSVYTGLVATRGVIPNNFSAGVTKQMNRSAHFARDNITSLQLIWGNWYWNTSTRAETATGGVATITASVEYPAGTFTQVKFSGSASGTIASGGQVISDATGVIIPAGAMFWVRMYWVNASGVVNTNPGEGPATNGDACFADATATDQTLGGSVSNTLAGLFLAPLAIIGPTRRPSLLLCGDSTQAGANEFTANRTTDATGASGIIARSITQQYGWANMGAGSERLSEALTGYTARALLALYCSHVISAHGINDLFNSRTAAQVGADRTSFAALFPGKIVLGTTIPPSTTSTDSWATTGNQTVKASETARTTFNGLVRAGISGELGYFDIADALETSRDSGLWNVTGAANAWTSDGVHPSLLASRKIQQGGFVPASAFWR